MKVIQLTSTLIQVKLESIQSIRRTAAFLIIVGLCIGIYTFIFTDWKYSSSGINGFIATTILISYGCYRLIRPYPESCTFDKTLDQFILKHQNVFGTRVIEGRLSEILDIRVEKKPGGNSFAYYNVFLVTTWYKRLPLTVTFVGKPEVANQLRSFLKMHSKL